MSPNFRSSVLKFILESLAKLLIPGLEKESDLDVSPFIIAGVLLENSLVVSSTFEHFGYSRAATHFFVENRSVVSLLELFRYMQFAQQPV